MNQDEQENQTISYDESQDYASFPKKGNRFHVKNYDTTDFQVPIQNEEKPQELKKRDSPKKKEDVPNKECNVPDKKEDVPERKDVPEKKEDVPKEEKIKKSKIVEDEEDSASIQNAIEECLKDINFYNPVEELHKIESEEAKINQMINDLTQQRQQLLGKKRLLSNDSEKQNSFSKKRNEFVFRFSETINENNFCRFKTYMLKTLSFMAQAQNVEFKLLGIKTIADCLWFKVQFPFIVKFLIKDVTQKGDLPGFKIVQLRSEKFFEDY